MWFTPKLLFPAAVAQQRVELSRFAESLRAFLPFSSLQSGAVLCMTTLRQNFIRELVIRGMAVRTHEVLYPGGLSIGQVLPPESPDS